MVVSEKDAEIARFKEQLEKADKSVHLLRDMSKGEADHDEAAGDKKTVVISEPAVSGPLGVASSSTKRWGKAPPIDKFFGEQPEVQFDDWLPSLARVAAWYAWSEEESLLQ